MTLKDEIRILGIDDSPFDKFRDRTALVIGALYRGGKFLDGVLSCSVRVDGRNSTEKLIEMINSSKFKPQLHATFLDGIAVAGFNIIDIEKLYEKTKIPVIAIMRTYPDLKKMKAALHKIGKPDKINLIEKAGEIHHGNGLYYQTKGASASIALEIIRISTTHSNIPEPLRAAHLIASGVKEGESRGRA